MSIRYFYTTLTTTRLGRQFNTNTKLKLNFSPLVTSRHISTDALLNRYATKKVTKVNYKGSNNLDKENTIVKRGSGLELPIIRFSSSTFPRQAFLEVVKDFETSSPVKNILRDFGISEATLNKTLPEFTKALSNDEVRKCHYEDCIPVFETKSRLGLDRHFLKYFIRFVLPQLPPEEKKTLQYYRSLADLSNPAGWFPKARRMKRKIIMHCGPTNSGKTYNALKRLGASRRGIYCGPLRLLAYEVWRRFMDQGIQCDLITGEEKIRVADYLADPDRFHSLESTGNATGNNSENATGNNSENATGNNSDSRFPRKIVNPDQLLVSATTEMLSVNTPYDVAVLDEIQLISDDNRGWGWTRALLGVQAKEIHLCGEPSAVNIVKSICKELDEEVEVHYYHRLSPLSIDWKTLGGLYSNLRAGDCFVAFSRKNIFEHKINIEKATGMKCAVVYGRMPPENRAQQARLFNDADSPYKIMIASDAVGMGLNLNIKRVIFDELQKFDGEKITKIPVPQVKQIAGRAGRFNTAFANGVATTFHKQDVDYLNEAMRTEFQDIRRIGIQPEADLLKIFSHQFPNDGLAQLLVKYICLATLDPRYFLCLSDVHLKVSNLLANVPLTFQDRHQFLLAPINVTDPVQSDFTVRIARKHAQGQHVYIDNVLDVPHLRKGPVNQYILQSMEEAHKCITIYLWLSFRFPQTFIDVVRATELKSKFERDLQKGLELVRDFKK